MPYYENNRCRYWNVVRSYGNRCGGNGKRCAGKWHNVDKLLNSVLRKLVAI